MGEVVKKTALAFLLLGLLTVAGGEAEPLAPSVPHLLRLHVRAHSDSPADQALKYQVRNTVLHALSAELEGVHSAGEAETMIEGAMPEILALAEETVRAAGFPYAVSVKLGEADFPTRLYGESVYRAGRYRALQIYIGDAQGENWWCVLFPPLCFVEISGDSSVPVSIRNQQPPKPRSRLLEWWQHHFGRRA